MPHNGSRAGAHVYVAGGYSGTTLNNQFEFCNLGTPQGGLYAIQRYCDGNGFISPPPPPHTEWWTNQLWAYGNNNQIWVLTWSGTCSPEFVVADMGGPGTMRLATAQEVTQYAPGLPPANSNRKYYIVTGVVLPARSDVSEPVFDATYPGKSGAYGFAYLVRFKFTNQTTPIGNIRWYTAENEASIQAGQYATSKWVEKASGFGLLRFMDMADPMSFPGPADVAQFAPPGVDPKTCRTPVVVNSAATPTGTKLGPNYWEIPVRSDKPTPVSGMVVNAVLPEDPVYYYARAYKTGSASPVGVVPAGKTYIDVTSVGRYVYNNGWGSTNLGTSHGLTDGDIVQGVGNPWWGGSWAPGWSASGDRSIGPIDRAYPATVVTTSIFSIDVNTAGENWTSPRDITMVPAPRIKYGSSTHYLTLGYGFEGNAAGDAYSYDRHLTCQFIVPWGRAAATHGMWYAGRGQAVYPHPKRFSDLANAVGSHCWYCIPPFATDEMVAFIVNWFMDNLGAGQQLWLELGNEVWNYGTHQVPLQWIGKLGQITKPNGQVTSTEWWWKGGFSYQNRRIHKLAKQIATSRGDPEKVQTVFGFQQFAGGATSSINEINFQLTFNDWYPVGDRPGDHADVLAIAPYYAPPMHYNSRADIENYPGWKEAIWKHKQGGTQRLEAFDWFRRQSMYTAEIPAGWSAGAQPPGDHFLKPGINKGVSLAADGDWTTAAKQWNAKLALYEWNSDWWPETIGSRFPRYVGTGHPTTQSFPNGLSNRPNWDTYEDTASKTLYKWQGGSTWVVEQANYSSAVNGVPTTRRDVLAFCLDYLYSDARAAEVTEYLDNWQNADAAHTYGCMYVINNPYMWRQIFTFWPSGPIAYENETPASITAVRTWSGASQPNVMLPGAYFVAGRNVVLTYTPAQVQPYYAMTKWNCFTRDLGLGVHNFTSHTFKVAFSLATPQVAWTRLSDVPQIGATGGYVAGGYAVTVTWAETAGVGVLKIEDKEITATSDGLSLRYAILYNDTAANDPLIGFYDFGPVTMQETDVLNINFDEAQGALRVQ